MSRVTRLLAEGLTVVGLVACSALSPQADQTQYFVLTPRAAPTQVPGRFAPTLGLGPVTVPDHLDERIVTRLAGEEIAISDTQRWAEPLRDSLTGVLQQNIAALLGAEHIVVYPWRPSAAPDLTIALEVTEFERTTHGTVEVGARWSIQRGAGTTAVVTNSCRLQGSFQGKDTRGAVAAMSVAVVEMSRRIAVDLRRVPVSASDALTESDGSRAR